MKTDGKDALRRLKCVILHDKTASDTNFLSVLKSDLYTLLSNYLDLKDTPEINLEVDENGTYLIKILAKADRVKSIRVIL